LGFDYWNLLLARVAGCIGGLRMSIDNDIEYIPSHGGNLAWVAAVAGCDRSEILDFSASINPLGCSERVIEMLRSPELIALIRRYPDPDYTELRGAIANYHQIDPDWIMVGNGAAELITWLGRDFAETVATVQLIVPAFGDYLRALRSAGAEVRTCNDFAELFATPNQAYSQSTAQNLPNNPSNLINQSASEQRDRYAHNSNSNNVVNAYNLGLLLNNPHNPSGEIYDRDRLLELVPKYNLVAIDEAFMDFLPDGEAQSLINQVENYPNLVILRSLTKFYALPGLRIGYAIAHPQRLAKWQQWRDPWSVNCVAQQAAIVSLADVEYRQKTWQWLPGARSQLYEGLANIAGLSPQPGAANYLLVKSDDSVLQLRNQLIKQDRILIRDCHSFPELGDRYFRVCVRTQSENARLIAALSKIINDIA
jgi:L-threonine-O-3-phosphate decarboxylase